MTDPPRIKWQALSWFAVVRTYQECNRRYAALLRHYDLTVTQFDVLNAILRLGTDATPHAIAEQLVVTRGNITGVLRRLQDHGWVQTRRHNADGRSFVCDLTAAGHRQVERARRGAALFIDQQLSPFTDEDLRQTREQMDLMRAHLLTMDPDAIVRQAEAAEVGLSSAGANP